MTRQAGEATSRWSPAGVHVFRRTAGLNAQVAVGLVLVDGAAPVHFVLPN